MRAILEIILLVLDLYVWLLIASAILSWLVAFNVVKQTTARYRFPPVQTRELAGKGPEKQ